MLRAAIGTMIGSLVVGSGAAIQDDRDVVTGSRRVHVVRAGESQTSLGARFGIEPRVIARINFLRADARLRIGQWIVIDDRHLAPAPESPDEIVVNLPQRMLFHFADGAPAGAYPVSVGLPDWPTFVGPFTITTLEENPVWDVPVSIQAEQRQAGMPVLTRVPPGPANPLGRHWIGVSQAGYGIHGTNAPSSIYGYRTHGCVRLHPDDVAALYRSVYMGMPGRVIYEPVLLTETTSQTILLEVHPDPYGLQPDSLSAVRALARTRGLTIRIDWNRVALALRERDGTPWDVTSDRGVR